MTAFETFTQFYAERWNGELVARKHKDAGRQIVGYPDVNCPEELVIAAGCLPMLMTGDPKSGLATAGPRLDLGASQPVRYLYEAILTGRYDFVDLICTTGGDRWIANTHGFLEEEKRIDPSLKIGKSYYLERLRATFQQHRKFTLGRLHDFRDYLEEFSGTRISRHAIAEACAITNQTRLLLRQISQLRKSHPSRISGCDALQIIGASMLMSKAEFNVLLRQFLDSEVAGLPREDSAGTRLFMSGSIVDNLQLYELIESLPATIVGEDTALGDRYMEELVSSVVEPMEALADRYTYKPLDPWMLGMEDRIKYRVNAAVASQAQGVVFFHMKNDDPVAWDYPDQKKALEKQGIPVLVFEDQEYALANRGEIGNRVETFIRDIQVR